MALVEKTKRGPYEIVGPLGAGGMGEVYRARDPRIGRDVAIKVLPSNSSEDPERLRRFEHEARAVGALNHPNILAIYDVGQEDAVPYLVTELLEGDTLRAKLDHSSLPQQKVFDFAMQIVGGLAAAHAKGIIHRDLKPENVFVTKDGRVKILDFGLAKLTEPDESKDIRTSDQTVSRATAPGVVLGTFAYMSPEQVRGGPVDARSDIFALGTVLYEMIGGTRPFHGASPMEVMSAILKEQPASILGTTPAASAALSSIVFRCLEKDPYDRFQSARDLGFALESISISATSVAAPSAALHPHDRRFVHRGWAWVAGVATLAALLLGVTMFRRSPRRERSLVATINAPENLKFSTIFGGIALSPDGSRLAFTTDSDGDRLWIRQLDSGLAHAIPGTVKAYSPFWSPDSKSIAFFTESKLKKAAMAGGPPQTICDAPYGRGGTWNQDGTILFTPNVFSQLFRVPSEGGEPKPVTRLSNNEKTHRWPYFLPDGRHFLYVAAPSGKYVSSVFLSSLDSLESKLVLPNAFNAVYAPTGHLLFDRGGNLMAQRFDLQRFATTGAAFAAARDKLDDNPMGTVAPFSMSQTGVLAYKPTVFIPSQLEWVSNSGIRENPPEPIGYLGDSGIRMSPDGTRLVTVRSTAGDRDEPDIWILDTRDHKLTRLTFDSYVEQNPVWSPDAHWIVYGSGPGARDMYRKSVDAGTKEELLVRSDGLKYPDDWSRDGRFILFEQKDAVNEYDLWILPLFGDRKPFLYLQTPYRETSGRFSPDGRWIAYQSDESGTFEIYVRPFPGPGTAWQVSRGGGSAPIWDTDGKQLFYIAADHRLLAVSVNTTNDRPLGPSHLVFKVPGEWYSTDAQFSTDAPPYDVLPGDRKFCFSVPVGRSPMLPITLVVNWNPDLQ